jgi:hypothetical protein
MTMMAKKVLVTSAITGAFFVGGAAVATESDQEQQRVAPMSLDQIEVAQTTSSTDVTSQSTPITVAPVQDDLQLQRPATSSDLQTPASASLGKGIIPGLSTRTGTLQLRGNDFYFGRLEVDFGPEKWLMSNTAATDVDRDGAVESWWKEISGLVGRSVSILGDLDDDDIDVFEVNGMALRPIDRPAPWSSGRDSKRDEDSRDDDDLIPATTTITLYRAHQIALEQVPGVIYSADLDSDNQRFYWEIEVRSTYGSLYDIEIDAESGQVLDVDRD